MRAIHDCSRDRYLSARCRFESTGLVCALGRRTAEVMENLLAGRADGVGLEREIVPGKEVLLARAPAALGPLPDRLSRYRFRNAELLHAAFLQIETAVAEAVERYGAERVAVLVGSSTAGIAVNEEAVRAAECDGAPAGVKAHLYQEMGAASEMIAEYAGLRGPCFTVSTACSSSAKVFAAAERLLRLGVADAAVVGGADTLSGLTVNGFSALGLLTDAASNPFSRNRQSIMLGEGAALTLLVKERGGTQLLGAGESSDAFHFSAPDPAGAGAERAMRGALRASGVLPEDVFYLNLHGTGTPPNDKMEAWAVDRVLGRSVMVSSTKPMTGHLLGASGALEAAICAELFACSGPLRLPPHLWDGVRDEDLPPLRFVAPDEQFEWPEVLFTLSNSFAFGGSNICLILGAGAHR